MSDPIDDLIAQIKAMGGSDAQIAAANGDPAKLKALADSLKKGGAKPGAGAGQYPGVDVAQGEPSSSGKATGIFSGGFSEGGENPSQKPMTADEPEKE